MTIQVNVPQDGFLSSTDNMYLCSGIQNTPGKENGTSLNVANREDEGVVHGGLRSTVVAVSVPPSACTANREGQYIEDRSSPNPLQLLSYAQPQKQKQCQLPANKYHGISP